VYHIVKKAWAYVVTEINAFCSTSSTVVSTNCSGFLKECWLRLNDNMRSHGKHAIPSLDELKGDMKQIAKDTKIRLFISSKEEKGIFLTKFLAK
jgi:hypothetical protein